MAYLPAMRRILWFLVGVGIAWAVLVPWAYSDTVPAQAPAATVRATISHYVGIGNNKIYPSATAFCTSDYSIANASAGRPFARADEPFFPSNPDTARCYWLQTSGGGAGTETNNGAATVVWTCPPGYGGATWDPAQNWKVCSLQDANVAQKTCPAGYSLDPGGTTCTDIVCPASGQAGPATGKKYSGSGGMPSAICVDQCAYNTGSVCVALASGAWACDAGLSAGRRCTTSDPLGYLDPATIPDVSDPTPYSCLQQGMSYGTVNGSTVCVAAGTPGAAPVDSKAGSGSSTVTVSPEGGQRSSATSSTTTVTFGADGTVTVRTITDPGGGKTTTDVQSMPVWQYCQQNPRHPLCQGAGNGNGDGEGQDPEPSTWGGACGAFNCSGDAIQCAIAKEIHQRNCQLWQDSDLAQLGNAVASGDDPEAANLPSPATAEEIDISGSISTASFLAGGCPADETFAVWGGQSVTIPWSSLCPYLEAMGLAMVALAMLGAARIVGVW